MGPVHATGSHGWAEDARRRRVLGDALGLVADPATADAIVEDALAMAGRETVPPIADGLRAFVGVHILDAIEARLGVEAADRVEETVDALLRALGHEQESAPAQSRGERGELVLVASSDPDRVQGIARVLATHADVEPILDSDVIPSLLWARLASVLVIDWSRAPLDPAVLEEIVAGTGEIRVVLWGAPPEVEESFVGARGTWIGCARTASAAHVAGIVLALVSSD